MEIALCRSFRSTDTVIVGDTPTAVSRFNLRGCICAFNFEQSNFFFWYIFSKISLSKDVPEFVKITELQPTFRFDLKKKRKDREITNTPLIYKGDRLMINVNFLAIYLQV